MKITGEQGIGKILKVFLQVCFYSGKPLRFSTLNKLCKALECMPGDILDYQDKGDEEDND